MSLVRASDRLELPGTLQEQLYEFRKRVWSIKMIEAGCGALFGVLVAFLALFVLDRVWETPVWAQCALFAAAAVSCAAVPLAAHRWIWRNRHLEQLARLLSRKHAGVGDQLLGIIELVRNDFEQARSRTLCVAAIRQVAEDAQKRDFRDAVPHPRHRMWVAIAAVPVIARPRPVDSLSGGGSQCLGAAVGSLAGDAAVHVCRRRAVGQPDRRRARRTVFAGAQAETADDHQAPRRLRPVGRAAAGHRCAGRRRLQIRDASANRARGAGPHDRRLAATRAGRADGTPRIDLGDRGNLAPRIPGAADGADERRPRRRALAGEWKPRAVRGDGEPRVGPFRD